ncbi:MAG TPA: hypothetical protein GX526_05990, partial [Thermoanaerobacterales bacterium]|nr:hypothetical protein [Thermoanaerobacterales bacterium]
GDLNPIDDPDDFEEEEKEFKAELIIYGVPDKMLGYPIGLEATSENIFIIDIYSTDGMIKNYDIRGEFINKFGKKMDGVQLPIDIAVDEDGKIYVADIDGRCIWVHNIDGSFISKIEPEEDEDLFLPRSLGINSRGELIVLSYDKIWKMDTNGDIIAKYGGHGYGDGQLGAEGSEFYIGPSGLSLDSDDNIYVSDTINNRIQIFDKNGKYLKKITNDDVKGVFTHLLDVKVDSGGYIYVTDAGSYYIFKLDQKGEIIERIGGRGGQKGKFGILGDTGGNYGPSALSISEDGLLYAVDPYNHRVQAFKDDGQFVYSIESEENEAAFIYPNKISIGSNKDIYITSGDIYIEDPLNFRVLKFNEDGTPLHQYVSGYNMGIFVCPQSTIISPKGYVYVLDLDMVQIFNTKNTFYTSFGGRGSNPGDFGVIVSYFFELGPGAMTFDKKGKLLIADKYNDRIQKFNYEGDFLEEHIVPKPQDLVVDEKGDIFVLSAEDGKIYKLSQKGEILGSFGGYESGGDDGIAYEGGEEMGSYGIACDSKGYIYITDTYNHRILKYSQDGDIVDVLGEFGCKENQFLYPKGIYIDSEDNLFVADNGNHRVMKFSLY